ncbi:MAG: hypothetical protein M3Q29_17315 [Chloroflexota bacterium]|nr:hypothetical protein [Chloroflexota bacterium]
MKDTVIFLPAKLNLAGRPIALPGDLDLGDVIVTGVGNRRRAAVEKQYLVGVPLDDLRLFEIRQHRRLSVPVAEVEIKSTDEQDRYTKLPRHSLEQSHGRGQVTAAFALRCGRYGPH